MDMVNRLIQIAKGIALSLGETCEAVVHDGDHRIAYIANGHISGREQASRWRRACSNISRTRPRPTTARWCA